MQIRVLDGLDPVDAAARLAPLGHLTFLDSARDGGLGRYAYAAADPFGIFSVRGGRCFWDGERLDEPFVPALKARLAAFRQERLADLPPFQGGAAGFLAYDLARAFEKLPLTAAGAGAVPEAVLPFYDVVLAFDLVASRAFLVSTGWPETEPAVRERRAGQRAEAFLDRLRQPAPPMRGNPAIASDAWVADFSRDDYLAVVRRTIDYILAGDIFQACLAQRFEAPLPPGFDGWAFYRRLRSVNAAPFGAWLDYGDVKVASSSPERFLRLDRGHVETRPIKGTAPRSADPQEDTALAAALAASEKDRAENLMIVDLLRNDLSRVCRPGSVHEPALCALESYANVHHLVSTVTGELEAGRDAVDLIAATFPGGSISGAPKIRAMEIIAELERNARGVFCGAIGFIGFSGDMDLNIAIRTVTLAGGKAVVQAGGGITMLSDPPAEHEETMVKARRIFEAFAGSATGEAA
ncbi:aminodeoxychorismate synthase component I [Chelatococcus sp. XZ-Ab1]|uniref:aminodeoxychorismate synthase component I n=1 Tax=Chelatococcus sp. XZ-Ab1 TaxID=3034027 RepID=UPI0023E3947D|nr:aminodeoxychorismate synthase component I [Chelatococcus sp. XZ-Ab1]